MKRTVWLTGVALLCAHLVHAESAAPVPAFQSAQPVWPEGKELERNLLVEFRSVFEKPDAAAVTLRLAGASLYRVFVNGQFTAHGPARAGHGFYRVDEWEIASRLRPGRNELVLEVAGYNANSFYLLDQPSFLQAEVVAGGQVIAATGTDRFTAHLRHDRVQKVQRYSFQRPFTEVWTLPGPTATPVRCAATAAKPLAPRRVPYPTFDLRQPVAHVAEGEVVKGDAPARPWKDRSLTAIGPKLVGFPRVRVVHDPLTGVTGGAQRGLPPGGHDAAFPAQGEHVSHARFRSEPQRIHRRDRHRAYAHAAVRNLEFT
jgi:alpha-L-rhamnosidase